MIEQTHLSTNGSTSIPEFESPLHEFTRAYIEAYTEAMADYNDPDGFDLRDIDEDEMRQIIQDCEDFYLIGGHLIKDEHVYGNEWTTAAKRAGHDFYITRHDEGSGFASGYWKGNSGRILAALAARF
jgi:hypothetical protein